MEDRGEVCLEEVVERLRRSGKSAGEIAQRMGVDPSWVEALISARVPPRRDQGAGPGESAPR